MFVSKSGKKRYNSYFKFKDSGYKSIHTTKQKNDTNDTVLSIDNRNRFFHKYDKYNEFYKQNTQKYNKKYGSKYCGKGKKIDKKYTASGGEIKRDLNASNFPKKYKIQKFYKDYKIDNIEEGEYKSYTICVDKHNTISEDEVRKMIDFDEKGNLILKKKNITNKDIRKITKYAFSKMYYAVSVADSDIIIPIEPLYFQQCQNGGTFGVNNVSHPSYLKDENGKDVEPSSFKEKLTHLMISKMRYPHPYPYVDTVNRANKVYTYQTEIRALDHTFLSNPVKTTNTSAVDDVVKKMVKYMQYAEKQNKNSIVSLPIAIEQEGHAVLLNCSFNVKENAFKVNVLNTNGEPDGFNTYGKPIFLAIEALLPKYIKRGCHLKCVYTDLDNQVGPTCMEYAEREGYNTLRRNENGITEPIEVMHNCLLRAGECELSKMLGLKSDIKEPEVKKISSLKASNLSDYQTAVLKKKVQKDYKNKQSKDDVLYKNDYNKKNFTKEEEKTIG